MIKFYKDGKEFISDNKEFLETNKYQSSFFFVDAALLEKIDKRNYAVKISIFNKKLIGLKVIPYNLMLFGDNALLFPLLNYLFKNEYEIGNVFTSDIIGKHFKHLMKFLYNTKYTENLSIDYMECKKPINLNKNQIVSIPNIIDLDEILSLLKSFMKECRLNINTLNKDNVIKTIKDYRIIKINNKIVSIAKRVYDLDDSNKIADVYTDHEYRGKGYARILVSYVLNEIINDNKIATLTVDKTNQISYHLYTSLGFKRVFSQSEYVKILKNNQIN